MAASMARGHSFSRWKISSSARRACAVLAVEQRVKGFFGAVQQAGLQVIHAQLILRMLLLLLRQVGTRQQVLVHADRALGLAAAAEQIAQREVHIGRFRVQPHDLDEGIDGLVGLLVEQEIQALK
jgi:hypothetical protein